MCHEFFIDGSARFTNNQPWSFAISAWGGEYFALGPGDSLIDETMVEKPDWADGRPGEIALVNLDIVLASDTGLPVDKSIVLD